MWKALVEQHIANTFNHLDEAKTSALIYVCDTDIYLVRYLDVTEQEKIDISNYWLVALDDHAVTISATYNCIDIEFI